MVCIFAILQARRRRSPRHQLIAVFFLRTAIGCSKPFLPDAGRKPRKLLLVQIGPRLKWGRVGAFHWRGGFFVFSFSLL